jgi:hypothetical protein
MAGEIGSRQISRDPPGFLGRGFRMRENLGDKIDQIVDLDGDHFSDFSPDLAPGKPAKSAANPGTPTPVLMTGLAGTLSEKSRACLPLDK